jgi:hypothetical protein
MFIGGSKQTFRTGLPQFGIWQDLDLENSAGFQDLLATDEHRCTPMKEHESVVPTGRPTTEYGPCGKQVSIGGPR